MSSDILSSFLSPFPLLFFLFLPAPSLHAQPFVRSVAPFPVVGTDGVAFTYPFLGGLNVPRPQFADLDGDGDLDLIVQEVTDQLMFFENTGLPDAPRFTWQTDRYKGLQVGEWARFVDLDGDGDLDLLAETPSSHVRYYRNDGSREAPAFTLAADTLRDTDNNAILSERQNVPALADIDCDGRVDLFLGTNTGEISYYAHEGLDADHTPRFRFVTDTFQDILVIGGAGKQVSERHGANALAFHDLDRDGDPDLLWGDFFEPGLIFFENTGTCMEAQLVRASTGFPFNDPLQSSGFNAAAPADIDNDGDVDLLVGILGGAFGAVTTTANNLYFYENIGPDGFALRTRRFLDGLDVGTESRPAVGDLDGDGDADLLVGNSIDPVNFGSGRLIYFDNQGNASLPQLHRMPAPSLDPEDGFSYAPALGDLDGDGDLDVLIGRFGGQIESFRNDDPSGISYQGRLTYRRLNGTVVDIDPGSYSTPTLADMDGDGDLDLLVGENAGTLNFYRNEGTRAIADFAAVLPDGASYLGIDVGSRSAPAFADLDEDGDVDLLLGSENAELIYYRNDGTAVAAAFVPDPSLALPVGRLASPALVDLDADGDLDLFVGGEEGGLRYFENQRFGTAREAPITRSGVVQLVANYPNPFRDATILSFEVAVAVPVRLAVFDVLGREVAVLQVGLVPAGRHLTRFEAAKRPAGLYLYVLTVGATRQTGTMVRVR